MKLLLFDQQAKDTSWLGERMIEAGFVPTVFATEQEALKYALTGQAEIILLDTGAQRCGTASLVRQFRKAGVSQPIVLLTEPGDWRDRVEAFDARVDDYINKPTRSEEIAARLRAIMRRSGGNATDRIVVGDIELDLKLRCGWLGGNCLDLTRNEFRLLRLFMLAPDRLISHEQIQERLQSRKMDFSRNAVEVQIARLRRKVGRERIRTFRGIGYRFISCSDGSGPDPHECTRGAGSSGAGQ